jgi:hypothetical protein
VTPAGGVAPRSRPPVIQTAPEGQPAADSAGVTPPVVAANEPATGAQRGARRGASK